ncbi:activated RNA polymerase II transcriptional coactivator p15 [Hylaeus volcanicus]|uniref:activated RNA polymerase II transcriptional coactivator p15 n=1 Tax=Hylaeus volcanicus TaxID=313075 RepID=UPI0023B8846C|nr:activated RNA polymerase II transcriptional coactivator p15 [Hylaeus volcanicus]XP_053980477.1 activated RNA polymerase II transcriptional coactivator p15 [Hylaeus volcanicus]XP_053980478.1 activated RNA polymerase II transcriptional coactivator p15 [Hylaeus volcanicus]
MPKSKEYVSSDDDSSEEDVKSKKKQKRKIEEKTEKPSKKPKQESPKEEENTVWDLGSNRQVTVRDFKGKLYVDIREMYYDKDANLKPGKKGICLNMAQWRKLLEVVEDVDKAVKSKC